MMRSVLVALLLFSSYGYAACRTPFNLLQACNKEHEADLEHWVCYQAEKGKCKSDEKGKDKVYYSECPDFDICQHHSDESLTRAGKYVPSQKAKAQINPPANR